MCSHIFAAVGFQTFSKRTWLIRKRQQFRTKLFTSKRVPSKFTISFVPLEKKYILRRTVDIRSHGWMKNIIFYDSLRLWHYFKQSNKFLCLFVIYPTSFLFTYIWYTIAKVWWTRIILSINCNITQSRKRNKEAQIFRIYDISTIFL